MSTEKIISFLKTAYGKAFLFILGALIIFTPLASSDPDGLERVAENLGAGEGETLFIAPLQDYLLNVGNEWIGTVLAGIIGIVIVVLILFGLSKVLVKK